MAESSGLGLWNQARSGAAATLELCGRASLSSLPLPSEDVGSDRLSEAPGKGVQT